MADEERNQDNEPDEPAVGKEANAVDEQETARDEDFQFALRKLVGAYQPILEEDLRGAQAPEALEQEERDKPGGAVMTSWG